MSKKIKFDVFLEEYDSVSKLPADSSKLIIEARQWCHQAYAPYSNFLVGAVVLLANGEIIPGTNQENAAFPSGLCAERVALFAASTQFPSINIVKLAVSALKKGQAVHQEVTPCGGCRQVLSEYQSRQHRPIEVIMEGKDGNILVVPSVDMLLPFKFSASYLD